MVIGELENGQDINDALSIEVKEWSRREQEKRERHKKVDNIKMDTEKDVLRTLENVSKDCYMGRLDTKTAQVIISSCHVALEALRQKHKQEAEKDDSEEFMIFK